MFLESKGYLVEHDEVTPLASAAFWHSLDLDSVQALSRLHEAVVSVTTVKHISPQPIISALQSLNITVGESGNILIALVHIQHDAVARRLRLRTDMLLVRLRL